MKLDENTKAVALAALILATAAVVYLLLFPVGTISPEQFQEKLAESDRVAIIMDLRSVSSNTTRDVIMNCGTSLAGSQGLVDKEKFIAAYEGNTCYLSKNETTVQECESMLGGTVAFHISGGEFAKTTYYPNRAEVVLNKTSDQKCTVDVSN